MEIKEIAFNEGVLTLGDQVVIRATVKKMHQAGEHTVLELLTDVKSDAQPEGTRLNILLTQVEQGICSTKNCNRPVVVSSLCQTHQPEIKVEKEVVPDEA